MIYFLIGTFIFLCIIAPCIILYQSIMCLNAKKQIFSMAKNLKYNIDPITKENAFTQVKSYLDFFEKQKLNGYQEQMVKYFFDSSDVNVIISTLYDVKG